MPHLQENVGASEFSQGGNSQGDSNRLLSLAATATKEATEDTPCSDSSILHLQDGPLSYENSAMSHQSAVTPTHHQAGAFHPNRGYDYHHQHHPHFAYESQSGGSNSSHGSSFPERSGNTLGVYGSGARRLFPSPIRFGKGEEERDPTDCSPARAPVYQQDRSRRYHSPPPHSRHYYGAPASPYRAYPQPRYYSYEEQQEPPFSPKKRSVPEGGGSTPSPKRVKDTHESVFRPSIQHEEHKVPKEIGRKGKEEGREQESLSSTEGQGSNQRVISPSSSVECQRVGLDDETGSSAPKIPKLPPPTVVHAGSPSSTTNALSSEQTTVSQQQQQDATRYGQGQVRLPYHHPYYHHPPPLPPPPPLPAPPSNHYYPYPTHHHHHYHREVPPPPSWRMPPSSYPPPVPHAAYGPPPHHHHPSPYNQMNMYPHPPPPPSRHYSGPPSYGQRPPDPASAQHSTTQMEGAHQQQGLVPLLPKPQDAREPCSDVLSKPYAADQESVPKKIKSVAEWQRVAIATGTAPSANRCVPLQAPIPSRYWGEADKAKETAIPDFHRLVNYPDYLNKTRPGGTESGSVGGNHGKRHCVMCGKLRVCSASAASVLKRKLRQEDQGDQISVNSSNTSKDGNNDGANTDDEDQRQHKQNDDEEEEEDDSNHIIPRQNKGLCTACDVAVWVVLETRLEIKWCKGCKNFRPWSAFGDKGLATKCVRCRDRQREKYAMQKDELRMRRRRQSYAKQQSPQEEKGEERHEIAAAKGLRDLMAAPV